MITKHEIVQLLKNNDLAVARALIALTDRQTDDEQVSEHTRYDNGRGFRPCHARMGTSMAKFFQRNGYLSPKQIAYWRAPMKDGKMRIEIYAGQLLEVAIQKSKTAAPKKVHNDIGNLMEEKILLQEQLDAYQEGAMGEGPEQDRIMDRLFDRLHQINEQVEEIRRCEYKLNRDAA